VSSQTQSPPSKSRKAFTITAIILAVIVIAFFSFSNLYADVLWFSQAGYLEVLTTQWIATGVMFAIGFVAMAIPVAISLLIAFRARPIYAKLNAQLEGYQQVVEPLRKLAMVGIPVLLGIFGGVSAASSWPVALQWLNRTSFNEVDPQFGLDIGFYFYELPMYHGIVGFASAVLLVSFVGALATSYLYGALSVHGLSLIHI